VTEMVTGLDLVREQIRIALGEPLSLTQEQVELRGHAIECRINAEDATRGFLPSPGIVTAYNEPGGPGVRVDSGIAAGREASGIYDPLVAKLIVLGDDREHARRRMLRALDELMIEGPATLIGFHKALLSHECFIRGETCDGIVESLEVPDPASNSLLLVPARSVEHARTVEVDGRRLEVRLIEPEAPWLELARRRRERVRTHRAGGGARDAIVSPMQGTVLSVAVADGDDVEAGQVICIVEAMKMENEVHAPHAGAVTELSVVAGQPIAIGQTICVLT